LKDTGEDFCTRIFGQKAMFSLGMCKASIIVLNRELIEGIDVLTTFSAIASSLRIVANALILFVAGPLIFNACRLNLSQHQNQLRIQPVPTTSGT
jgi:hypothetical protein